MDITKVIGLEGGKDSTWFRVLAEEERCTSTYYPAIVNGEERGWSSFATLDEYLAHKVPVERETIRLTVAGNAVAAEDAIQLVLGCKALATNPTTVDVYPGQPLVATPSAASALGSMKSEAKAAAARENGKRGGRPRKERNMNDTTKPFSLADASTLPYHHLVEDVEKEDVRKMGAEQYVEAYARMAINVTNHSDLSDEEIYQQWRNDTWEYDQAVTWLEEWLSETE